MQPKRHIQQIDKAEVKFKPVAIHSESVSDQVYSVRLYIFCIQVAREKLKRDGNKAVRADRDQVVDMLFQAFEKHQFYKLVDLQRITQQPPVCVLFAPIH